MSKVKSSIKKESLEERLERIRKKNEEIEKKHQIAERDRLIAKMQNALVEIKPTSDYRPKEHKFDKLDITYDVSESELEAEKAAKLEMQQRRALKAPKFTDIPPDPTTFLADDERDGIVREAQSKEAKEPPRVNKGRALVGRKKFPKSASQPDFPDNTPASQSVVGGVTGTQTNPNWRRDDSALDDKFQNLTVSTSQDGEFKSVRLTQAPVIGSGRVGPRQITKTQFQPSQQQLLQQQQQQQQQHQMQYFDKNQAGRKSDRKKSGVDAGGPGGFSRNHPPQQGQQWKGNANNNYNANGKPFNQHLQSSSAPKGSSVQDRLKRPLLQAQQQTGLLPTPILLPPNTVVLPTNSADMINTSAAVGNLQDFSFTAAANQPLILNFIPVNGYVPDTQHYAQNA